MPKQSGGSDREDSVSAALSLAGKPPGELTLQDKLLILFATIRARKEEDPQAWRLARRNGAATHPNGRPEYTNTYVCKRVSEEYGVVVQPDYLGKLRNGSETTRNIDILMSNPGLQHKLLAAGLQAVGLRAVSPDQASQESTDEQVAAALAKWLLQRGSAQNEQNRGPTQP